jgi:TRAP-type C4-dicarboxylate transport system permease small subunit
MLIVAGGEQALNSWLQGTTSDTLLAVPQVWPQLAFPIGGLAIALQGLAHAIDPRRHRMHDASQP